MHEDVKEATPDSTTNASDKSAEKKPWVTPVATAKSVPQVTRTGLVAGKDASCQS